VRSDVARTLTVARVRVQPGAEHEYLAAVQALAALAEDRGRNLWVFRHSGDPQLFLECSESQSAATHRSVAPPPADERRLEERIRAIATYEQDAWDLWEEVRS
jgi:hypothetical protein